MKKIFFSSKFAFSVYGDVMNELHSKKTKAVGIIPTVYPI